MKDNLIIFGTGSVAYQLYTSLDMKSVEIISFVNSDSSVDKFCEYPVILPEEIKNYNYDYIIIASGYVEKILSVLLQLGIEKRKIVSFIYDESQTYKGMSDALSQYLNEKYNRDKIKTWLKGGLPAIYPAVFWRNEYALAEINKDFVREQQLVLVAKQLDKNKTDGAIAECGVFRGDFTVVIDRVFQERKLYLYDSFEGFSSNDVFNDATIDNKMGEKAKFKDTNVELVLDRLGETNNTIIVKKGFFPESFDEYEERFSFVSIDFNLYDPVFQALDIFYDKMINGGYILVSDYNAPFYDGTKRAVDDWCEKNNKNVIPVPDFYGSILLVKE